MQLCLYCEEWKFDKNCVLCLDKQSIPGNFAQITHVSFTLGEIIYVLPLCDRQRYEIYRHSTNLDCFQICCLRVFNCGSASVSAKISGLKKYGYVEKMFTRVFENFKQHGTVKRAQGGNQCVSTSKFKFDPKFKKPATLIFRPLLFIKHSEM